MFNLFTCDMFESFVNSEESKTIIILIDVRLWFESFVNSEESKTKYFYSRLKKLFESFVNSEESKTLKKIDKATS